MYIPFNYTCLKNTSHITQVELKLPHTFLCLIHYSLTGKVFLFLLSVCQMSFNNSFKQIRALLMRINNFNLPSDVFPALKESITSPDFIPELLICSFRCI